MSRIKRDGITVHSNYGARELVAYNELPESALSWFDYIDEDEKYSPRFFQYLGSWYDLNEFLHAGASTMPYSGKSPWVGVQNDSIFSATVVRYYECDGDIDQSYVVVGRAHW